jgi:hypothetical protein
MELLDRLGQKIGETVGIYSRTADEDENFVRQEKLADATRYAPSPCMLFYLHVLLFFHY